MNDIIKSTQYAKQVRKMYFLIMNGTCLDYYFASLAK